VSELTINCFEARQDFAAFWRKELTSERRTALVAHVTRCAECDRAFRNFSITAPVLHSAAVPAGERRLDRMVRRSVPATRPSAVSRGERRVRRWFATSAAAMLLIGASMAAYLSVTTPIGTLTEEMAPEPTATQALAPDAGIAGDDLGG
jgi:anti-sigma factor RsiW